MSLAKNMLDSKLKNGFIESEYLNLYPDVAAAVKAGTFKSGYEHYEKHGKSEGRSINLNVHRKFQTKRSSLGAHSNIWQYIGQNFNDKKYLGISGEFELSNGISLTRFSLLNFDGYFFNLIF
jgi:hypothetical protein